ncbi:AMP-binding protein [Nocardia cyriacigeorgica]|uniref:AMP-binding protein n=1 Tax=Nocardia cyriacigeorgica TaxID=135487 RepID=UPI0018953DE9|nr:AMP-binding protein [Nocardia cyriacigeorgica]MBF6438589.1 AMP-binding protein [Nocardia cyriacigeorgica]
MSIEILDVIALSPLQRGLYSVSAMSPGVDPYLVTFTVRIENLTELSGLRIAFDELLQRYPHLAGAVLTEGLPHPVLVVTSAGRIAWHEIDLRGSADPEAEAEKIYWAEGRRRLDLDNGPLFRVTAARLGDTTYQLICTAHHIVVDGWSIPLLFSDLIALHRGEGAALPPAPPLRDHAAWIAQKDTEASVRAWTTALADLAPMPMVGPPAPAEPDLAVLGEARFGVEETEFVTAWARANGLTLNTVLEVAWARILSGLTGRDDVVFGQTTSGRDATLPGADRIVGALITTIPVRVRVDQRAPAEVAAPLQKQVAELRTHEYLGISEITRHAGVGQLFDTLLVFENSPMGAVTAAMPMGGGARMIPRRVDSLSHYPITVVPLVEHGQLICRVEIRPDLVDRFEPERMARRVLAVVRRLADAPRACDVSVLLDDEPAALSEPEIAADGRIVARREMAGAAEPVDANASPPTATGSVPTGDNGGVSPSAKTVAGGSSSVGDADAAPAPDDVARRLSEVRSVPELLLAAVADAAGATAVIDDEGEQSFAEFGAAVQTLARALNTVGVRPGDAVAVMLPRDRRVVQAPFAVGLAGALCVHVDPATPADRLAYILEVSGARFVLADDALADAIAEVRAQGVQCVHAIPDGVGGLRVAAGLGGDAGLRVAAGLGGDGGQVAPVDSAELSAGAESTAPGSVVSAGGAPGPAAGLAEPDVAAAQPATPTDPESPFYVVFTSGTTGRPKGVAVPHRALLNHWSTHERRIFAPTAAEAGRQLRIGHGWSTGFDAAWQPTIALLSGHAVVLLGDKVRTDAEQIVGAIATHGIDIFDTSPSMLNRLIDAGLFSTGDDGVESCPLRILALGGEAISLDTWRRLQGLPTTRVINFYGPTETTVEALMADVHDHAAPTIGNTFDNMAAEVLDHRLRPVPPGGQGELYLSGPQLAVGYLGRPATTAAAFVAGPHGRRYRTGDLVRRAADGTVVYEGRIDSQVKINGYRVEPDEATVVMRELDGVAHAAALAFVDNGRTRLGALVVADLSAAEIRTALARRLPQFLVPTRIVHVDQIPLNRNDKLDVHAATALLTAPIAGGAGAEPATDTERALLEVIAAMGEGASRVGITDSLVDLGIDSIGVIDLVSRLRGAGYRVGAKDVLGAADLRDLARVLDERGSDEDEPEADAVAPGTVLPLTPLAHEIIANGNYRYLAQSQVISLPDDVSADEIIERLGALALAHPTLRSRLTMVDGGYALLVEETSSAAELLSIVSGDTDSAAHLADTVARLDPDAGRMVAATVLDGPHRRLLLSVHHLAVDVVSWLILVDDLRRMEQGSAPLNETGSTGTDHPAGAAASDPVGEPGADTASTRPQSTPPTILGTPLGGRLTDPLTDRATDTVQRVVELGPDHTEALLARCTETGVPLDDALILACALAFPDTADDSGRIALTRETHGRPADDDTRRVGWFTVEETVSIPHNKYRDWTPAQGRPDLTDRTLEARAQLRLNHLGRFDVLQFGTGPWTPAPLSDFTSEFGISGHPDLPLRFTVDITTAVVSRDERPALVAQFDLNSRVLDDAEVEARTTRWLQTLTTFAEA